MAKSIMIQGTASGAGKSLLVAGLCRLLRQDGLRAVPFKSQNMALNSFITPDGLEIGRAQAIQAEAAGIPPSALMNPILLKPHSDTGSQVIVRGKSVGSMSAAEYFAYKRRLVPVIRECYGELASRCDVVVIEGAGSPAEINLKQEDIVNMGLAELVDAPVLLAGDIDRGGVFASLYGTVALLEPHERKRVKGMIINKFRGDPEILRPGLAMLEDLTGIPVAGVVPHLSVDIEEEDSLTDRLREQPRTGGVLDIAVLRLPHIAGFTDFHPLEKVEGVAVRMVEKPGSLGRPDLILLPGTSSPAADLLRLRQSGLEAAVRKATAAGTPVMGLGGGYRMLGRFLATPTGTLEGMGLLPITADMRQDHSPPPEQCSGCICALSSPFEALSGTAVTGYRTPAGSVAAGTDARPFCRLDSGAPEGVVQGNVLGTGLHGLFEAPAFTASLLEFLLRRKGLPAEALGPLDYAAYKEQQYDLLADALRRSLDMDLLYGILEASGR